MISEGSRDTEDWSNYAENSALHHIFIICLLYYIILRLSINNLLLVKCVIMY